MGKNTIKIDGMKLRKIIEDSGNNIYEIPVKYGFSKNLIQGAIAKNEASVVVQNLLKNIGIDKEDYIVYENTEDFFPVNVDSRLVATLTVDELREIIREVVGGRWIENV